MEAWQKSFFNWLVMTHNPYSFNTEDHHRYTFVGVGKGRILKAVDFSPTAMKNVYNLGLGDLMPDGSIDVTVKSNSGDILKVLATVVLIARIFTNRFPNAEIFFIGKLSNFGYMAVAKKKNIRKGRKKSLPNSSKAVVVVHTVEKETLFPEKLKKANEILSKTKFLDR
jgi:hypothetical protein